MKNGQNINFGGLFTNTEWNFKTGEFLNIQVPVANKINGWTQKTNNATQTGFTFVRNSPIADQVSISSTPSIILNLSWNGGQSYRIRRGHGAFKTQGVLPNGSTLQKAIVRITRTLLSNPNDAFYLVKTNSNLVNTATFIIQCHLAPRECLWSSGVTEHQHHLQGKQRGG